MVTPEMEDELKVEMSAICDPEFGRNCEWEEDNFFVLGSGNASLVKLSGATAVPYKSGAVEPKRSGRTAAVSKVNIIGVNVAGAKAVIQPAYSPSKMPNINERNIFNKPLQRRYRVKDFRIRS